jgi:mannitol/fructose-specific phosphotransferase system IIA component (Ntr-type)
MRLTDIVIPDAIIPTLGSADRDQVLAELLDALIAAGAASPADRKALLGAVLEREKRGSTGFGKGVAVPHVKHGSASGVSLAIGLSQTGVDFNSLDKQPVYSVFLLLSPADNPEEHLKAMEVIFKNLSYDTFRRFLRQATTKEAVLELLEDADSQQLGG